MVGLKISSILYGLALFVAWPDLVTHFLRKLSLNDFHFFCNSATIKHNVLNVLN